jgi:hypothetical protein
MGSEPCHARGVEAAPPASIQLLLKGLFGFLALTNGVQGKAFLADLWGVGTIAALVRWVVGRKQSRTLVLAVKSGRVARVTTGELINLTVQTAADAERVLGILRRRAPQGVSE